MRNAPFGGRLTATQVEGTEAIINEFERAGDADMRKLAYILATAFHETGGKMIPVREGFAKTDARARHIIRKRRYAMPDATSNGKPLNDQYGHVYYGRGHVQLTWADNYKRMGDILGIPLLQNPDLALDPDYSARILVEGMMRGKSNRGDFTGKALEDYFNDHKDDPVGARRIVNGTDKANLIATYHKTFLDALQHAAKDEKPYYDADELGTPDKPSLLKDNTTIGAVSAVAGSGAFGVLSSIDSPWAFAAFAVIALGAFLYFTGRIKIVRHAGA